MKLLFIKILHTLIWIFMASCVMVVLAAGVFGFINAWVYGAIGIIFFEGIILLIFNWKCPLTIVAQKYTENREDNFDIFLPKILAKHNKTIFTTMFIVGLVLILLKKFL